MPALISRSSGRDLVRIGRFTPVASSQRVGYGCAALLVASAAVHGVVFLVNGGSWEGPVSWRKPIVFGLSFGITLATITWFMSFLRPRRVTAWLLVGAFAVASLAEVFLVSMQRWRGVPSHFNESTAFDGAVFSTMGALVSVLVLLTVIVAVLAFLRLDAPPAMAWAIRSGLILLLVSQAVGVQMITEGGNTFGAAGALKVPHAVTLHAVQVLPALALLALMSGASERRSVRVVVIGTAGYIALIAATMVQAYGGRGPLDPGITTTVLAALSLALLVASALDAVANALPLRAAPVPRVREPH